jgi:hypothetical protein
MTDAPVKIEDTPAFWPIIALEAWVLARDPSAVDALCRSLPAIDKVALLLRCQRRSDRTIRAVRREIWRDLKSGKVRLLGDRGTGRETIPAVDLSDPKYLPKTCTYWVGQFNNLGVARDEARRRWRGSRAGGRQKARGGRPPKPYKAEIVRQTLAWLDDEGAQTQSEIIKFMIEIIAKIDDTGGPSDSTLKTWASEILVRFQGRLETIGQPLPDH